MEKLLDCFKNEFPKDAMEIQECIELLNQCIDGSVESIKAAASDAFDKRDFDKMSTLQVLIVEVDKIQNRLDVFSNILQLDDDIENKIVEQEALRDDEKQIPDYDSLRVDSNIPYTLYDDYTHKRPAGFEIFGDRFDAKDWKEVLVKTCEILSARDVSKFYTFINDKSMQGRKVPYFSKDSKGLRAPRKVLGTDVFVMTNMSANQVRNVIERMLRKYGIKINEYKLYLKADYTARHE